MKVLSLFDGISCGRLALERVGVKIDAYYASEIDKQAIQIAQTRHPDIIQIGDVAKVSYRAGVLQTEAGDFPVGHIDLIIGGSPCTDFSPMGYAQGMVSGQVELTELGQYLALKAAGAQFAGQSYLFWEYVRLLQEVQPDFYLLENVAMALKWRKIITGAMGCEPVAINSALVSAQNRPRLYWTNIRGVQAPSDRRIVLDDILDPKASTADVSHCQTVQRAFVRLMDKYGYIPERFNPYNATELRDKACALSRGSMVTSSCATLLFVSEAEGLHSAANGLLNGKYPTRLPDGRYNLRKLNLTEMERLQTLPDGYTAVPGIGIQKRGGVIGNGWTVDAVAHVLSYL